MANLKLRMCVFSLILVTIVGQSVAGALPLPIGKATEVTADRPVIPDRPERSMDIQRLQATDVQGVGAILPIGELIEVTADRLEAEQITDGPDWGSWHREADFTGSIVAGMVSAYESRCDPNYKSCAELGGDYILWAGQGNYYGDEAYALTRLSEIAIDPCNNGWRTAQSDFYFNVKHGIDGTEGYISQFQDSDPSTAVFYLANYLVAACYVEAEDKQIWREALLDWLCQVADDDADFPVLALGVATWALAQTGPLDDTPVDRFGTGAAYWSGRELEDLPGLLLSHQVPDGQPYAGSFYWRFDHKDTHRSKASGYTEDTIFGTLGLVAADKADPELNYDSAILNAGDALLVGVQANGKVYEHLWLGGEDYYTYAGEMLQALGELVIPGDLDLDGGVNFIDFANFANNWLASGCTRCSWCNGADLDENGEVNYVDLEVIAEHWLEGTSP